MIIQRGLLFLIFCVVVAGCASSTDPEPMPVPTFHVALMFPDSGVAGSAIVLRGNGFGTTASNVSVTLNGEAMKILSVHDDAIIAATPSDGVTGPVVLRVGAESQSVGTFTVISKDSPVNRETSVCCVFPDSARPGDTIIIYGANVDYNNIILISIGNHTMRIVYTTSTGIVLIVPDDSSLVAGPMQTRITAEMANMGNTGNNSTIYLPFTLLQPRPPAHGAIELDYGGITGRVEKTDGHGDGHEQHVERRDTSDYLFQVNKFAPVLVRRMHGPNGIDTLEYVYRESHGTYDDESKSISLVIDTVAGHIASLTYSRSRYSHPDGPTTGAKFASEWVDNSRITFTDLPCTRTADGGLECTVRGADVAAHASGLYAHSSTHSGDVGNPYQSFSLTTFLGPLPIGPDAYVHVRMY